MTDTSKILSDKQVEEAIKAFEIEMLHMDSISHTAERLLFAVKSMQIKQNALKGRVRALHHKLDTSVEG